MNQSERDQLIEEYGQGYQLLRDALAQIPPEEWAFKPAPTEWSVRELIGHMADSEILGATRMYMIAAMPGTTLMSYDDDQWARVLNHPGRNIDETLQLFHLIRRTNYALLKTLPKETFANSVIHPDNPYPEFGDIFNLEKWLRIYTRHVRDHIDQLQAIHRAWRDLPGP